MTHIDKLTNEQLNHLAAKAQDWFIVHIDDYLDLWSTGDEHDEGVDVKHYTPTTNAQQAMDLLKVFDIVVQPVKCYSGKKYSAGLLDEYNLVDFSMSISAPTPELAIVKAVVASKYGMEIDEGELG